ncbi:MAG: 50S ribosomal protein L1, partial [Candidatus Zixiibacteriota bacterium]
MHKSKRFKSFKEKVDPLKSYAVEDAVEILKGGPKAKFDESVEMAFRLGVDPKHADQMVRGTVVLPHGLGKSKRVIANASGVKVREAREAGA